MPKRKPRPEPRPEAEAEAAGKPAPKAPAKVGMMFDLLTVDRRERLKAIAAKDERSAAATLRRLIDAAYAERFPGGEGGSGPTP